MSGGEIALHKAAGKVMADTADGVKGTIATIFGDAANEFGLMLGDQVRYRRFKNLARIMTKAQDFAKECGLNSDNIKALPFGDAIRVIEAASDEEDETVQDMWAHLIANRMGSDSDGPVQKVHIEVLKSLSAPEAIFLELLSKFPTTNEFMTMAQHKVIENEISAMAEVEWRKFPEPVQAVAIQNLQRLRCITFRPSKISSHRLFYRLPRTSGISGEWAAINPREFEQLLNDLYDMIGAAAGVHEYHENNSRYRFTKVETPEMLYALTALGTGLMNACRRTPEPTA